jgi:hypothetical protein
MKNPILTKLITVIDIQLGILLILILVNGFSNAKEPEIPTQDVLGTEIEREYSEYTVSVCHIDDCVYISSDTVMKDGKVDKGMVYQEVLENVISYFERGYGGKGVATSRNGEFIYWNEDERPDLSNIYDEVYTSFLSGMNTNVEIDIKELPGTDGRYATKYIEIDNSRQKLFVWENGEVIKEILLSGPKEGYAVYGVYPIVDKGVNPQAPTGSYMPYWMAFYYSPNQESWYGLHGLIWWYDENGRAVYEPTSNIGIRRSGGCIRMIEEDAKYLYENFEKGDPILIHE